MARLVPMQSEGRSGFPNLLRILSQVAGINFGERDRFQQFWQGIIDRQLQRKQIANQSHQTTIGKELGWANPVAQIIGAGAGPLASLTSPSVPNLSDTFDAGMMQGIKDFSLAPLKDIPVGNMPGIDVYSLLGGSP